MAAVKKAVSDKMLGFARIATERELKKSANSTSCVLIHQPKAPKALSKFRKF